jgi:N,N'-diacetyllegionaminate synthase
VRTPFVIAEFGSCHQGDFNRAVQGIEVAKAADADAYKLQYWSSAERMRERRHVTDPKAYVDGSVLRHWLPLLADHAHAAGLEFMCTAYLPEDIEVVAPYVDRFKVASFEAGDENFVDAHGKYGKQVIVSTGMTNKGDCYYSDERAYLHCVSAYPAPLDQTNLSVLRYDDWEDCWINGYSDHTRCIYTGGFAVSAGADILEVHYRLDDTNESCPDYPVALSPDGLGQYIMLARLAHTMRGDGVKRPMPSETPMMKHRVLG